MPQTTFSLNGLFATVIIRGLRITLSGITPVTAAPARVFEPVFPCFCVVELYPTATLFLRPFRSFAHLRVKTFGMPSIESGEHLSDILILIFNLIFMSQIHVVLSRINPALLIDLVRLGRLENGQFVQLPLDLFSDTPISDLISSSDISDSAYLHHKDVSRLVSSLSCYPGFSLDYFDNTLVIVFDFILAENEVSTPKEDPRS